LTKQVRIFILMMLLERLLTLHIARRNTQDRPTLPKMSKNS